MGIFRITQLTSKECDSHIVMRVPYRSSALQWLGPFFSKKRLHIANEWQDLNNRGKGGFWLLSQSWEVWLSLPQKAIWILEADLLYWVLSSTWGQLNLYWDCDFLPARRKPVLSSFSLSPIFSLTANVSCESLLTDEIPNYTFYL